VRRPGPRPPTSRSTTAPASTRASATCASRTRRTWATQTSIQRSPPSCAARSASSDLGARVDERHPGFENAGPIFQTHWFSGAAALIRTVKDRQPVDPGLLEVAEQGAKITAAELIDAQMKRGALGMHMNLF